MNDLALLLDLFGNSEETKLLICTAIFVWCLQRHRNGGLNSGQKSAIIVTDALKHDYHNGPNACTFPSILEFRVRSVILQAV